MLAAGLGPDARIRRRNRGSAHSNGTLLLALIADRLGALLGVRDNRIAPALLDGTGEPEEATGFDSPEAFRAAWAGITGGEGHGG